MKIFKLNISFLFLLLISVISIYFLIAYVSINRPLQADEVLLAEDAQIPFHLTRIQHSPLYQIILRLLYNYLHLEGTYLRIFGVFCFLVNIMLIYFLGKNISQNKQAAILGCILFAINPLSIQGSLLLNIDYTILTVLLTLFILYFSTCYNNLKVKDCFFLGCLFFLSLFSKFTTPLVLIPAVSIFYWLKRKTLFGISRLLLIILFGVGVFLAVWSSFSYYYKLPFFYFIKWSVYAVLKNTLPSISVYLKYIMMIFLWLGSSLLLLLLIISLRIKDYFYRKGINFLDFCLIYIIGIFIVYLFIGVGVGTYKFFKYQYPILPILAVMLSDFISKVNFQFNKRTLTALLILMPIIFIYNTFVIGDILYLFNYTLRYAIVFNPSHLKGVLWDFSSRLFSYLLFILLVYFTLRFLNRTWNIFRTIFLSIMIVGICANLSQDILQARADYTTNYYYGRDRKSVV